MKYGERTREKFIRHYQTYPNLQITDVFKYLYQSSFGCGHMVSSADGATDYIFSEYSDMGKSKIPLTEELDGEYSRVSLAWLDSGLDGQTLGKLFFLSAREETDGKSALLSKLEVAKTLVKEGSLPFSIDEFEAQCLEWEKNGYPAVRHSKEFRDSYAPAYRVVLTEYVKFLPFFARIDKALKDIGSLTVAIEGGSASGKTTLSNLLSVLYDCNVFHMDDFFLRPEQRTKQRLCEVGGNVDRERFFDEVLLPLSEKKTVCYRPFDCQTQTLASSITVEPKKLTFVEGAYSMHGELAGFYDLSVFLDIEQEYQRERILKRNSQSLAKRFFEEWIPMENEYFSKTDIAQRCDMVIKIKGNVTLA